MRTWSAATILKHVNAFMQEKQIKQDEPIDVLKQKLQEEIVSEALAEPKPKKQTKKAAE